MVARDAGRTGQHGSKIGYVPRLPRFPSPMSLPAEKTMRSIQERTVRKSNDGQSVAEYTAIGVLSARHKWVRTVILLMTMISIGVMVYGCREERSHAKQSVQKPGSEAPPRLTGGDSSEIQLISFLRDISQSPLMPDDVKDRARGALQGLENGALDRTPTLVLAYIRRSRVPQSNAATLHLVVVDEDLDLRGFTIREQSRDPNGAALLLEEHYAAYADSLVAPPVGTFFGEEAVSVRVRSAGERKDGPAWAQYVIHALDDLIRRHTTPEVLDVSTGFLPPGSAEGIHTLRKEK